MSYFELVDNASESDVEYTVLPSLAKELEEIYTAILKGEPMVHQLKMLKQEYPQSPQVYNMLSLAYVEKEDFERAYQVNHEAYNLFPDYIFSRLNMVQEFLNTEDLEKAAAIIDPALTIDKIFPNRKKIHVGEFINFQRTRALYYAKADLPEEFLDIVEDTEGMLEDEIAVLQFRSNIMEIIDMHDLEEFEIISDYVQSVNEELNEQLGIDDEEYSFVAREFDEDIQTEIPPVFNHAAEIEPLYQYGFEIPGEVVEKLLELPRETLVADLREVLNDAVRRYQYYSTSEETDDLFPWHAMQILANIKAAEALPDMLNFLRQGNELNEFYMGDLKTEALWQVFYPFCILNKNELLSFLKEPGIYAFCRLPVISAFTQLALHQTDQRETSSALLGELINFYTEKKEEENFLDPDFMSLLCEEVMDGGFTELKLLVKNVYENELEAGWYEDYKEWEEEYANTIKANISKKPILNWRELNKHLLAQFQDPDEMDV